MMDDPHDPMSGYRPDMDQYPEPEDEGNMVAWGLVVGCMLLAIFGLLTWALYALIKSAGHL